MHQFRTCIYRSCKRFITNIRLVKKARHTFLTCKENCPNENDSIHNTKSKIHIHPNEAKPSPKQQEDAKRVMADASRAQFTLGLTKRGRVSRS